MSSCSVFFFLMGISFLVLWSICWSSLRMVTSILRGWKPRYLSLWWDFYCELCFQVVFLLCWSIFYIFSFLFARWIEYTSYIPSKFPFLWAFWLCLNLIVLFLPYYVIFFYSLLAWHIFLCQNSIPISSLPLLWCTIFLSFGKRFDVH